jgi:hypothetical protein
VQMFNYPCAQAWNFITYCGMEVSSTNS